jgi:hypothetical protein
MLTLAAAAIATLLLISPASAADPPAPVEPPADPARQFDYWCGTWDIHNDRLLPDGTKQSGPATLTVRPILDGSAILEQGWEGSPDGELKDVFGMSLRYYDAALKRWVVILCWPAGPTPGARFARMEGGLTEIDTDPACVLYPPECFKGPGLEHTDDFRSRFIFSEATPASLRWALEIPYKEQILRVWDMHFTRTADAIAADAPLDVNPPPDECACTQPEARDLDWLVGQWSAIHVPAADPPNGDIPVFQRFTLRASSATRGCTTFLSLDRNGSQDRFVVLAYNPDDRIWHAHSLDAATRHAEWQGQWDPDAASLTLTATDNSHSDRVGQTLTLTRTDDDTLTFAIGPIEPKTPPILKATFTRAAE